MIPERFAVLNPKSDIDAQLDGDGDGFSNLEEYLNATNPAKHEFSHDSDKIKK